MEQIDDGEGYLFTCTNRDCKCLKTGLGLFFTTDDVEEAEKHSQENNSPMWISKKYYDGVYI